MSEISNGDLMGVLLQIKGDVGELKSTAATTARALKDHASQDVEWFGAMNKRLSGLELAGAASAGKASVWTLLATSAGTIAGAVGAWLGKKFGWL